VEVQPERADVRRGWTREVPSSLKAQRTGISSVGPCSPIEPPLPTGRWGRRVPVLREKSGPA